MIFARFFLFLGGQKKQKGEKTGYLPIFAQKSTMDKRKRNILISIVVVLAIAGVIGAGNIYYLFFSRMARSISRLASRLAMASRLS